MNLQVLVVAEAALKAPRESEALKEFKAYKELKALVLKVYKVQLVLEHKEHRELLDYKVFLVLLLITQTILQKVLQTSTLQLVVSHMITCKERPVVPGRLLII